MNHNLIRLKRLIYSAFAFLANRWPILVVALVATSIIILFQSFSSYLKTVDLSYKKTLTFFDKPISHLANTSDRTNFLILGIRGFGDQGEDLTDTMILISYSHSSKQLSLLSIPRDLWISSLQTKNNSVYNYGKFKEEGGGSKLVKSAVLETLGLPVHYVAVVDFNFFKKVIDTVSGIDVNVEHTFIDNKFPLPGQETALPIASRYETISFQKGLNHFNGDLALKFVRSRNAGNEEGTDTARNQRQQLVIQSIKEKVFTKDFLMNSKNLESLYQVFKETIETDVASDLYPSLARLLLDSRSKELNQIEIGIEKDKNGLVVLESPKPTYLYHNQWVLIAKDNNWKALKQYLQNRLDGKQ